MTLDPKTVAAQRPQFANGRFGLLLGAKSGVNRHRVHQSVPS